MKRSRQFSHLKETSDWINDHRNSFRLLFGQIDRIRKHLCGLNFATENIRHERIIRLRSGFFFLLLFRICGSRREPSESNKKYNRNEIAKLEIVKIIAKLISKSHGKMR